MAETDHLALLRPLTRRSFLGALLGGAAAQVGACQSPSTTGPAASASGRGSEAATGQLATGRPAASGQGPAGWEQQWNALIAAARQEGKLVVSGPPNPATRRDLPEAFKSRFGIDLEYFAPGTTSTLITRMETERASGQYTVDAILGGAQSLFTVGYDGILYDPIPPVLIHPEATNPAAWPNGKLWFMDPDQQYILRLSNYVTMQVSANAQFVSPDEIKTWRDLLEPRYRGKISVYEPTIPGTGWNDANYLLRVFGEEFIRALYVDQQPGVSRDTRQISDWMARGTYPISLGLNSAEIEPLKKDGFPIALVLRELPEAPGIVTAGFGLAVLVNKAPNPNAAKLFINWVAMREGQEVWNRSQETIAVRLDIDNAWAPDYVIPKRGVDYFDSFGWDYTIQGRSPEELERLRRLTRSGA
jgi:iron(III) transport system substrate-binding protein